MYMRFYIDWRKALAAISRPTAERTLMNNLNKK
jgi:hypothetical protein